MAPFIQIALWYHKETNMFVAWVTSAGKETPKAGTVTYMLCIAVLTAVQPLFDSSEHFSICFSLELVWHFVVARQAYYMYEVHVRVDGTAVREPACRSDWKSMFRISRLSSSVWGSGRGLYQRVVLLSVLALELSDGIGRVVTQSSLWVYKQALTLPHIHRHCHTQTDFATYASECTCPCLSTWEKSFIS